MTLSEIAKYCEYASKKDDTTEYMLIKKDTFRKIKKQLVAFMKLRQNIANALNEARNYDLR